MKNIKYLLGVSIAGLLLTGCADLDTAPNGQTITQDQKNPEKASASVTAITSMFSVYGKITGDHNDFGYPSVMLFTDSRGTDLVGFDIGYNWFSAGLTLNDYLNTSDANSITWCTIYNQIYTANSVVKTINLEELEESQLSNAYFYLAQALAIRAFDYFTLAQLYQFTYQGNEDAPCVPVVTEKNTDDVVKNGCPRNTVQEVYDQIMSDLNQAVEYLDLTQKSRDDKRYLDLSVALGLRARVNLVMCNYEAAAQDAQRAISTSKAKPLPIDQVGKPGFKDMTESNWMWGISIAETDRVVTTGICNWPSHMGSLNYGYASVGAWRKIAVNLYNSIPVTDMRKAWWLDGNGKSTGLTNDQQNYVTEAKCPPYTQVKFAPYKDEIYTSLNANDIPLMRIEEMYYILAEAQAMGGNPAEGLNTLTTFTQTYRNPSYSSSAGDAESVRDAVWQQRRIELWGEGLSYYDILRLRKGIDRRGTGIEAKYNYVITDTESDERMAINAILAGNGGSAGTTMSRLIYQIPNAEIEANPLISTTDNNLTSPTPTPVN